MKKMFILVVMAVVFSLGATSALAAAKASPAAKSPKKTEAQIEAELHTWATAEIKKMNRLVLPSLAKKEVTQNPDGTWTARYIEVDEANLRVAVRVPNDNAHVDYVGYLYYAECEMVCTAATKEEALNGTFTTKKREGMTELVKYMKGKWGY